MSNQPQTSLDVWAAIPFSDSSELVAAMSDPRYKNNTVHPNRFVEAVERKLALSEGVGTDSVRVGDVEQSIQVDTTAAGEERMEQLRKEAEDRRSFGDAMGNGLMVLPPAR